MTNSSDDLAGSMNYFLSSDLFPSCGIDPADVSKSEKEALEHDDVVNKEHKEKIGFTLC